MSITTFRLAREQEELKAREEAVAAEETPVNCPMPTPKTEEKAPAPAPRAKTAAAKA